MAADAGDAVVAGMWWVFTVVGVILLVLLWWMFLGFAANMSVSPANDLGVNFLRSVVTLEIVTYAGVVAIALRRRRWHSFARRAMPWLAWLLVLGNGGFLVANHVF